MSSYGAIHTIDLAAGQTYTVDSGHLVGWDEGVQYDVKKAGSWKSTILGGEGFVVELTGPGRVYVQTRSPEGLIDWIVPKLPTQTFYGRASEGATRTGTRPKPSASTATSTSCSRSCGSRASACRCCSRSSWASRSRTTSSTLDSTQRALYVADLVLAAVATCLLIAPVAHHRLVFRRHRKETLLMQANRLAILGLVTVAAAVCGLGAPRRQHPRHRARGDRARSRARRSFHRAVVRGPDARPPSGPVLRPVGQWRGSDTTRMVA